MLKLFRERLRYYADRWWLIDYYKNFGGYLLQFRIEPPKFRRAEREAARLIDAGHPAEALKYIESLPVDWQNDPDFMRLSSLAHFEKEE